MVSQVEAKTYKDRTSTPTNVDIGVEATSADDFRIDILGTQSSPWNKSAARVFADLAIQDLCLPNTHEMYQAIVHAFKAHLDTIIKRYKKSLKTSVERAVIASKGKRQTRKYQLYHRRRYLAYAFTPLHRHIDMLEFLGIDGMSSDESEEDENHHTQYKILCPAWRGPHVSAWLRMFDTIHNILRRSGDVEALRGSFPHLRILTQRKSPRKTFVPGLPMNVYDPIWISRDIRTQYVLHPSGEPYDFTHDPNIVQCVIDGKWCCG
ncbi:hypothetical protein C8J57DRAFT_1090726 [Mycena rebaudengoi]|nr:hypothetical protein C8J57DRAFT_1090726 [Mycena rebaudengoi]